MSASTTVIKPTCMICPAPSVVRKRDSGGTYYRACAEHRSYLSGWVRDANNERYCESRAAADFEDRAYGRD